MLELPQHADGGRSIVLESTNDHAQLLLATCSPTTMRHRIGRDQVPVHMEGEKFREYWRHYWEKQRLQEEQKRMEKKSFVDKKI